MNRRSTRAWFLAALASAVVVAGCGGKGEESSGGGGGGDVKTGPGVTESEISLGLLTDLSGVFAALGKPIVQGTQLYWKQAEKVCGRTVKLDVKDHGYDPQKAVSQYRQLSENSAALQQLLGSPITAALLPQLKSDSMLSILAAWPSTLLTNDFIIEVGAPYDIEMINGLDKLLEDGKLKEGDKVGHIYFEGEYGENGLLGSKEFTEANGMELVEQKIKATDEDLSGQVAALKKAGVKAIAMTTAPTQFASVAGLAASQDFNVPIMGNNPVWNPALLETPAADALKANGYVSASISPYNLAEPGPEKVAGVYEKAYPKEVPQAAVQFGWSQGQVMNEILTKACDDGDLTREGIVKAARTLDNVDLQGLTAGPLDYSKVGEPPTRAVYISQPDDVPGGLKAIDGTFESDAAKEYQLGTR